MKQLKVTNGINRIGIRIDGQAFTIKRRKDGYLIFHEENKIAQIKEEERTWTIQRPDGENVRVRLQKESTVPITRPQRVERIDFCLDDRNMLMIASARSARAISVMEAGAELMTTRFGWLKDEVCLQKESLVTETLTPEEVAICLALAKCMDKSNDVELV